MKMFWKDCTGKKKNYSGNKSPGFGQGRQSFFEKVFLTCPILFCQIDLKKKFK